MKNRKSFFDMLEYLCIVLLVILLIGMISLISLQVISRYIFESPFSWTEEFSRHLMIWSAFIGSALAYRRNAHLGVDLIVKALPAGPQKAVLTLVHAAVAGFAIFLLVVGSEITQKTMVQLSSALRIPMGYIYLSVPVGAALILLFSLERIHSILKGKELLQGNQPTPEH